MQTLTDESNSSNSGRQIVGFSHQERFGKRWIGHGGFNVLIGELFRQLSLHAVGADT